MSCARSNHPAGGGTFTRWRARARSLARAAGVAACGGAGAAALCAGGCASLDLQHRQQAEITRQLHDRGLDPASIVVPWQIDAEMREWVHQQVPNRVSPDQRLSRLLGALLDGDNDGLGLEYEAGANGTAQDAFASGKANCLAFTNLFVGLARELDVPVFYLEIGDIEKFARAGNLVVQSGHVTAGYDSGGKIRILDFDPEERPTYRQLHRVTDLTAIALYYSNLGAQLLERDQDREALGWLDTAVRLDPELARAWINRGVALRRTGDPVAAEAAYRRALEADPNAVAGYQDLAALLFGSGRSREGEELMALSARLDARNPFNLLSLGDLSVAHGRLDEARRFYRKAERQDNAAAEAEAALGELSLATGDRAEARRWLQKARSRDAANDRVRRLEAALAAARSVANSSPTYYDFDQGTLL
jgi:tetratricopeptide (TPR) repeat protein